MTEDTKLTADEESRIREKKYYAEFDAELHRILCELGMTPGSREGSYSGETGAALVLLDTAVTYEDLTRLPGHPATMAVLRDLEQDCLWRAVYTPIGLSHIPSPRSSIFPLFLRRVDCLVPRDNPTPKAAAERAVNVLVDEVELLLTDRTKYIHLCLIDRVAIASGAQDSYERIWWYLHATKNAESNRRLLASAVEARRIWPSRIKAKESASAPS